jgi:general stress protein 26
MTTYQKALEIMNELFAKDCQFALATAKDNVPTVRMIDTFYEEECMYIVTHSKSNKVLELTENSRVSLCSKLYRFSGNAYNIGHPLLFENKEIRENLTRVFEPWYFAHNNENDPDMCYIKIELISGFFYKDQVGYKVDFKLKEAIQFPFDNDIVIVL